MDPFNFEPVPSADLQCRAEGMLREYLDELFAILNRDRVKDSCARERALASVIRGVVEPLAMNHATKLSHRDLTEIAFGELEDRLGWYGEDASILELYAGIWPAFEDESHSLAEERFRGDPYSRHTAYWHRCVEAGCGDFLDWSQNRDDRSHTMAVSAIDGAAVAVGDE